MCVYLLRVRPWMWVFNALCDYTLVNICLYYGRVDVYYNAQHTARAALAPRYPS